MDQPTSFDIRKILEFLPHRYPFLLVDRVNEIVDGEYIKAHKCVSFNEPFFQGHFPGVPVMPGVLIIEALAQAACWCCMVSIRARPPGSSSSSPGSKRSASGVRSSPATVWIWNAASSATS